MDGAFGGDEPFGDGAVHTTTGLDQSVLIRTDSTATARQGLSTLAASRPGLALEDTNPTSADGLKDAPPEVWINLATIVVLLVCLLLSIANKLVAATALTTVLLLSAPPLALLGQGFLGRPGPARPVWLLPALVLTVTVTAFLTIELPTRQALRTPPADAIRAR